MSPSVGIPPGHLYEVLQYGRHSCWQVNNVWYPPDRVPVRQLLEREKWADKVLSYGPRPLLDRFVSHASPTHYVFDSGRPRMQITGGYYQGGKYVVTWELIGGQDDAK